MIENIAGGIISNFLTDFIKSCLGLTSPPPPEATPSLPSNEADRDPGDEIAARRAQNHDRVDAANAAIAIAFSFLSLLLVASMLPVLSKGLAGQVDLAETRIPLDYSIGTFKLGLVGWVVGLPLFWLVQNITQRLIELQHSHWSDVSRRQVVRLFTISCFLVLPFHSALVVFLLFPSMGIVQSIVYPLGVVLVAFLVAYSRRGR